MPSTAMRVVSWRMAASSASSSIKLARQSLMPRVYQCASLLAGGPRHAHSSHPHLHTHGRPRRDRAGRRPPGTQGFPTHRGLRHRRRAQLDHRARPCVQRRAPQQGQGATLARRRVPPAPERALRSGLRAGHPGRRGVRGHAPDRGERGQGARGAHGSVPEGSGATQVLRVAGWRARGRLSAPGAHGLPPRGASHPRPLARGNLEPVAAHLREPAQRSPLRALALGRQEGRGSRVSVGARPRLARAQEGMTAGFVIKRAGPADHPAVARELAEYLTFIGDTLDPEGLDHDIAHWQEEYDGRSGVLLLVVDPAGEVVGTAAACSTRVSSRRGASVVAPFASTARPRWPPPCISTAATASRRSRATTTILAPTSGWSARSKERAALTNERRKRPCYTCAARIRRDAARARRRTWRRFDRRPRRRTAWSPLPTHSPPRPGSTRCGRAAPRWTPPLRRAESCPSSTRT